jgi:hypothetical protein
MKKTSVDRLQKTLLLFVAVGLTPIALSYGLIPEKSLDFLYNIQVTETNLAHILRAVMGLYLALIVFWFIGAFKTQLRLTALYSLAVFMLGLAAGRILSVIADGVPHWLLLVYLALELLFGILALVLIRKSKYAE